MVQNAMTDEQMHRTLIGRRGSRGELNTPVLLVDLDALKRNIERMARFAQTKRLNLRPHTKTHKSVHIAQLQREAGAVGFSCAKLGEAEVLAEQGLNMGLLLTSPVVSAPGIKRLAELNRRTEGLMCVVDNPKNVRDLGKTAKESGLLRREAIPLHNSQDGLSVKCNDGRTDASHTDWAPRFTQ